MNESYFMLSRSTARARHKDSLPVITDSLENGKKVCTKKKNIMNEEKKEEKERKEQACFRGSLDFVLITCASPEDRLVILKHITYQIANRFIGHCMHASSATSSAESNFV